MNEQDDEQTMRNEWMEIQRQRFILDAKKDAIWLEHINRQTVAMERLTLAVQVLVDMIVTRSNE